MFITSLVLRFNGYTFSLGLPNTAAVDYRLTHTGNLLSKSMRELQHEAEKIQVASRARRESSLRAKTLSLTMQPDVDDACLLSVASKDKGEHESL